MKLLVLIMLLSGCENSSLVRPEFSPTTDTICKPELGFIWDNDATAIPTGAILKLTCERMFP
jgi:hypothetical protein